MPQVKKGVDCIAWNVEGCLKKSKCHVLRGLLQLCAASCLHHWKILRAIFERCLSHVKCLKMSKVRQLAPFPCSDQEFWCNLHRIYTSFKQHPTWIDASVTNLIYRISSCSISQPAICALGQLSRHGDSAARNTAWRGQHRIQMPHMPINMHAAHRNSIKLY